MDLPKDSSGPPLDSAKEEDTSNTKMCTAFKKTVHQHKWLVSHLTFSDKLDVLQSHFTSGEASSGSDVSYITPVVLPIDHARSEERRVINRKASY